MDGRVGESIERLLALPEGDARSKLLRAWLDGLGESEVDLLAEGLIERVIQLQMEDTQLAMQAALLILALAKLTGRPQHRALGLRAQAQTLVIGLGEYQRALPIYDEALEIYRELGDEVSQARLQVTRIWALASTGKYDQAIQDGEWARNIFVSRSLWRELASLSNNLAAIHRHAGESAKALSMLATAEQAYRRLGPSGESYLANVGLNRALALYELGELEASLQASQTALELARKFNQTSVAAIIQHNLGMTCFRLGRPAQALHMYDQAREVYSKLGQVQNAALCDLASLECLLELGRYREGLEKCESALEIFLKLGMRRETAEVYWAQAEVYARQRRYERAIEAVSSATEIFQALGNRRLFTLSRLFVAGMYLERHRYAECLAEAQACVDRFTTLGFPFERAQAQILAARAAAASGQSSLAEKNARLALAFAREHDLTLLLYQCCQILGELAWSRKDLDLAQDQYDMAIRSLQRLRGNVMVEHRAGFLIDKDKVYEETVALNIESGQVRQALNYAEQAKSQALHDILAHRLDLSVRARTPADLPLVQEIRELRRDRERLLAESAGRFPRQGAQELGDPLEIQKQVRKIEDRVTELWHKLLVRDADYARQANLWGVVPEVDLPRLPAGSLLVEYYAISGELVVFLVSGEWGRDGEKIRVLRLPARIEQVQSLLQRLVLNLRLAPGSPDLRLADLAANAQGILYRLYQGLLEPFHAELSAHQNLIIVPHGLLHYLPFHALYDGRRYLLERHPVSYLPGISFFDPFRHGEDVVEDVIAIGFSAGGKLPYAVLEANQVAELFGGNTLLESSARREELLELAPQARLLHFACHGEFRTDNPLFSGLELADGWLTTLDVFNLRLQASLVTLSACQTGRSVIGGGDELQGLMRAFLAAGAMSLVLTHWPVEDRSTATLMEHFYRTLIQGVPKGEALREAQLGLLHNEQEIRYCHPYYWAPFHLVGDSGPL